MGHTVRRFGSLYLLVTNSVFFLYDLTFISLYLISILFLFVGGFGVSGIGAFDLLMMVESISLLSLCSPFLLVP